MCMQMTVSVSPLSVAPNNLDGPGTLLRRSDAASMQRHRCHLRKELGTLLRHSAVTRSWMRKPICWSNTYSRQLLSAQPSKNTPCCTAAPPPGRGCGTRRAPAPPAPARWSAPGGPPAGRPTPSACRPAASPRPAGAQQPGLPRQVALQGAGPLPLAAALPQRARLPCRPQRRALQPTLQEAAVAAALLCWQCLVQRGRRVQRALPLLCRMLCWQQSICVQVLLGLLRHSPPSPLQSCRCAQAIAYWRPQPSVPLATETAPWPSCPPRPPLLSMPVPPHPAPADHSRKHAGWACVPAVTCAALTSRRSLACFGGFTFQRLRR